MLCCQLHIALPGRQGLQPYVWPGLVQNQRQISLGQVVLRGIRRGRADFVLLFSVSVAKFAWWKQYTSFGCSDS